MINLLIQKRFHQYQSKTVKKEPEPSDLSWTYWNGQNWNGYIQVSPEHVQKAEASNVETELHLNAHNDTNQLPLTPFKRGPLIAHRFTKKFRALSTTCDFCNKQIGLKIGLKCVECKYSCHKDCEHMVPPSCGVPAELMSEFKQTFILEKSNHLPPASPDIVDAGNGFFFSAPKSNSRRSIVLQTTEHITPNSVINHRRSSSTLAILKNYFEELSLGAEQKKEQTMYLDETVEKPIAETLSHRSAESISLNESIALSIESVLSDSTEDRQSEWGIPFNDIKILDVIGSGRFGVVKRAHWHGDVAVKLLNANYLDDAQSLDAFKIQIATFKNTRHDNLILFMGFCMEPQAIITSLCKGNTLFTHIHLLREKFNLDKVTNIALQISNGMSYLHAKEIVHKDLTTKNIFLENYKENYKVVITDFGLFSVKKLRYNNGLHIPLNWLCHLAPELIRSLKQTKRVHDELKFSKETDVFSFGTVWYEILSGEFPFKLQSPHSIIFQIGSGMKQTLANLQATREVKDILMLSWAFQSDDRPDFNKLLQLLKELQITKKQMPRTPTRKVNLFLWAESVF
ncbi:kinase suppressor of Ras 2-like isoform X2 [Contarinia nasturtii]|uniref:kinase suppressor of Ras 2-like isoform X2 n=1 Tax=Contarinia nasturtii TaxID=265458 RepID=UPI0012D3C655|nr:kinase suppressor of Ras 2-like isoform X2 [Contarinia nasturtii]